MGVWDTEEGYNLVHEMLCHLSELNGGNGIVEELRALNENMEKLNKNLRRLADATENASRRISLR